MCTRVCVCACGVDPADTAVPAAAPESVSRELRAERPAHHVSASSCAVCGPRARRPEGARAGAGAGCRRCPHGAASAGGRPHPPLRTAEPRVLSAAVPGPAAQGTGGGAGCAAPARPSAPATPTASQTTRGTVGASAGAEAFLGSSASLCFSRLLRLRPAQQRPGKAPFCRRESIKRHRRRRCALSPRLLRKHCHFIRPHKCKLVLTFFVCSANRIFKFLNKENAEFLLKR